jgi:prephenate dehydratase
MSDTGVAYLGPPGTYSHLVAEKRFGKRAGLRPYPTILDICYAVSRRRVSRGIVPIENSSGGAIHETVDILLTHNPRVYIAEELSLLVRLALIGHPGRRIQTLYSHFAPLEHCAGWLRRHLPKAQRRVVASTASAAERAAAEDGAAALGSRRLASMYGLKVLHYPVEADVPNITSFLVVVPRRPEPERPTKTTLAVRLPNRPGALCSLLETFRDENVNLSRLISRPIRGCPREYAFLVDIAGNPGTPRVKRALDNARKASTQMRLAGSYPTRRAYTS